jgi:hypothetical protein
MFDLGRQIESCKRGPIRVSDIAGMPTCGQLSPIFLGLGRVFRPVICGGLRVADGLG